MGERERERGEREREERGREETCGAIFAGKKGRNVPPPH